MREAAHLKKDEDTFKCDIPDGELPAEERGEEEQLDDDKTLSEVELESNNQMDDVEQSDENIILMRRRVLQHEPQHGAAEGEGGDNPREKPPEDEDDESFEEEESPRQRYQRYVQSSMDEVSDVEEWQNIHYGYAHDVQSDPQGEDEAGLETARSRSRGSARDEPQAKTMPKPLAQQVKRRIALDTALDMAETLENSGTASGSSASATTYGSWKSDSRHFERRQLHLEHRAYGELFQHSTSSKGNNSLGWLSLGFTWTRTRTRKFPCTCLQRSFKVYTFDVESRRAISESTTSSTPTESFDHVPIGATRNVGACSTENSRLGES